MTLSVTSLIAQSEDHDISIWFARRAFIHAYFPLSLRSYLQLIFFFTSSDMIPVFAPGPSYHLQQARLIPSNLHLFLPPNCLKSRRGLFCHIVLHDGCPNRPPIFVDRHSLVTFVMSSCAIICSDNHSDVTTSCNHARITNSRSDIESFGTMCPSRH